MLNKESVKRNERVWLHKTSAFMLQIFIEGRRKHAQTLTLVLVSMKQHLKRVHSPAHLCLFFTWRTLLPLLPTTCQDQSDKICWVCFCAYLQIAIIISDQVRKLCVGKILVFVRNILQHFKYFALKSWNCIQFYGPYWLFHSAILSIIKIYMGYQVKILY